MANDDARLRNQALNHAADREDRLHAVVNNVYLAASSQFAPNSAADDLRIELDDIARLGPPILRGRLDDRHVTDADE
jgi:hypothetical protein